MLGVSVREELPADVAAIHAVHARAFATNLEARIVDALRNAGAAAISQVAVLSGSIVGHVLLSPVRIERSRRDLTALGLAPLSVVPEHQRKGIGAILVRRALDRAHAEGVAAVVLVGEPHYYERFGFIQAKRFGLRCKWPGTDDAFMALELTVGALADSSGLVSYHRAFDILEGGA